MRLSDRRVVGAGVELPALGLGTAPLGWLFTEITEDDAVETVRAAVEQGIRYADTAPSYGLGLAERRLGAGLAPRPADFVISSKAGRLLRPPASPAPPRFPGAPDLEPVPAWAPGEVRRSIEESLQRLATDRIDIVYLHDGDDAEDELRAVAIPELVALREEGLVGGIGVGMNQSEMPARLVRDDLGLDVILVAGRYSVLEHDAVGELLPLCEERDVAVVLGGVLGTGLLANAAARYNYREPSAEVQHRASIFRGVCAAHGVDPVAAALQFPFGHPAVASIVVGMRSPDEVLTNVRAFETQVPPELWDDLRGVGTIPEGVPTP